MKIFERPPEQALEEGTPLEICNAIIASVRRKAYDNEMTSRLYGVALAFATAAIPVFLVLSTKWFAFVLGKVIPAALAGVAALITALLSVDKPHERWRLYRGYQRIFETERLKYQNTIGDYAGQDKDERFLETLVQLQLNLNDEWAGLVPKSTEAAAAARSK